MKALLLTRCGCSKMTDVPAPFPIWRVSLTDRVTTVWTGLPDESAFRDIEVRTFEFDRMTQFDTVGEVAIYRERRER